MRNLILNEINESRILSLFGRYWNTDYDGRCNQLDITFKSLDNYGRAQTIQIGNIDLPHIDELIKQLNLFKEKLFTVKEE